jgi:hypothetical protein
MQRQPLPSVVGRIASVKHLARARWRAFPGFFAATHALHEESSNLDTTRHRFGEVVAQETTTRGQLCGAKTSSRTELVTIPYAERRVSTRAGPRQQPPSWTAHARLNAASRNVASPTFDDFFCATPPERCA